MVWETFQEGKGQVREGESSQASESKRGAGTCRRMRLGWEFQVHRRSVRRDGGDVLDLM